MNLKETSVEISVLEDHCSLTLSEMVHISGLSDEEVKDLVEFGVLDVKGEGPTTWVFHSQCVPLGQSARRLRSDFDLNLPGLALALNYLKRIKHLERKLHELECQLLRLD